MHQDTWMQSVLKVAEQQAACKYMALVVLKRQACENMQDNESYVD